MFGWVSESSELEFSAEKFLRELRLGSPEDSRELRDVWGLWVLWTFVRKVSASCLLFGFGSFSFGFGSFWFGFGLFDSCVLIKF